MGLSIQQIMQLTGLSEDSIKQLIAKKENWFFINIHFSPYFMYFYAFYWHKTRFLE
jgi:hypothetical protein